MTASPPVAQPRMTVTALPIGTLPAQQRTGLQRVYVASDGRHHWSRDLTVTFCGLPTSKADATKPGDVECSVCQQLAEAQHDGH